MIKCGPFIKIDPGSDNNLGYHCNPPPPLNLPEFDTTGEIEV